MSAWRRALWFLAATTFAWSIVSGAASGDWMASTSAMAGLAVVIPFWLRAERRAAVDAALGGDDV